MTSAIPTGWPTPVEHGTGDAQFLFKHVTDIVMHRAVDFDAHRVAPCPLLHHFFNCRQEIGGFVYFDLKICIPGDPERKRSDNFKTGEEQVEVGGDDLFKVYKMHNLIIAMGASGGIRYPHEAGKKICRDFEPGKQFFLVLVPDDNCKV